MRPANFALHQPSSVSEAVQAIASGGTPLAGGQSLVQAMRLRTESPTALIDLANIGDLSNEIEHIQGNDQSVLRIGARVTHQQLIEDELVLSLIHI